VLSDSDFSNMNVIRELLYIKHNFADMTLYSKDEIDFFTGVLLYKLDFIYFYFLCFYVCVLCTKLIINK